MEQFDEDESAQELAEFLVDMEEESLIEIVPIFDDDGEIIDYRLGMTPLGHLQASLLDDNIFEE